MTTNAEREETEVKTLIQRSQAEAFNEWMRRYIEEPERFEREMTTVNEFMKAEAGGVEPDYGQSCAAYLQKLMIDEKEVSDAVL